MPQGCQTGRVYASAELWGTQKKSLSIAGRDAQGFGTVQDAKGAVVAISEPSAQRPVRPQASWVPARLLRDGKRRVRQRRQATRV